MKKLLILLILLPVIVQCQVLIECASGIITKGTKLYQVGISVRDTTIKEVVFELTDKGTPFCFGKPELFDKGVKDKTGQLYIYNPEQIINSKGNVWMIHYTISDARTGKVLEKCYDGILFPVIVNETPNLQQTPSNNK